MTTFALIHGANGSGAGFTPLGVLLQARGHRVVAPDLPIEDRNAGFSDYTRTAVEAIGELDDDLVVVAHSMGGASGPYIADVLPVREVVYVAALIPQAGRTLADLFASEPMMQPGVEEGMVRGEDGLRYWGDPGAAAARLFPASSREVALRHVGFLRGQAVQPYFGAFGPLPDVPSRYVVCTEDEVVSPAWGREAAPRLLGVDAIEIPGGHDPQVESPRVLADLLLSA